MKIDAKLVHSRMVKISVHKTKGICHKTLKKMLKLKSFNFLACEQTERRYVYYIKVNNELALYDTAIMFQAIYDILRKCNLPLSALNIMEHAVNTVKDKKLVEKAHKEGGSEHYERQ